MLWALCIYKSQKSPMRQPFALLQLMQTLRKWGPMCLKYSDIVQHLLLVRVTDGRLHWSRSVSIRVRLTWVDSLRGSSESAPLEILLSRRCAKTCSLSLFPKDSPAERNLCPHHQARPTELCKNVGVKTVDKTPFRWTIFLVIHSYPKTLLGDLSSTFEGYYYYFFF